MVLGKWGVSKSEFEGEKYLYYMEGSAFIVSNDLAFNLYNLSRYVFWPPFSISLEDVIKYLKIIWLIVSQWHLI